jgi:hypothetical protein
MFLGLNDFSGCRIHRPTAALRREARCVTLTQSGEVHFPARFHPKIRTPRALM